MLDSDRSDYYFGLFVSAFGHLVFAAWAFISLGWKVAEGPKGVIYSVTMEPGQSLGGLTQVPTDTKTQKAPPKKVQASEKVEPKEIVKEDKKSPKPNKEEQKKESLKIKPTKEVKQKEDKAKKKQETAADINKQLEAALQRYRGESTDAAGKGFGAGALGGKGMGGGTILPAEAMAYRETLKNVIKEGWRWYDTSASLITWATFDIGPDGTISNVLLSTSSGNREFDDSVLRAIWKASPVPAPPDKVYKYFKQVRFAFDPRE